MVKKNKLEIASMSNHRGLTESTSAYQLDRKVFTEFVLIWKNAMLSETGYIIEYPQDHKCVQNCAERKGLMCL